jgi:uncharacterized protein with WD repeat
MQYALIMRKEAKHSSSRSYFSLGNTPDTVKFFWETTRHITEHLCLLQYALAWSFVRLHGVHTAKDTFANGVRMYTSHRRTYVRHFISERKYRLEIQTHKKKKNHTYFRLNVIRTGTSHTPQRNNCKAARLDRERENLVYRN